MIPTLTHARELGFLGPGPVEAHIDHAEGFALGVSSSPASVLDLGSGGGVPGLVLALRWPAAAVVLLDATARRCAFLRAAIGDLGLGDRVRVVEARAEEAGRAPDLRASVELVVARSFGAPGVTAECAAPFLVEGGRLVVSEPPEPDADRWPASQLGALGLEVGERIDGVAHYQVLLQRRLCPDTYPRRVGVPSKRPLF